MCEREIALLSRTCEYDLLRQRYDPPAAHNKHAQHEMLTKVNAVQARCTLEMHKHTLQTAETKHNQQTGFKHSHSCTGVSVLYHVQLAQSCTSGKGPHCYTQKCKAAEAEANELQQDEEELPPWARNEKLRELTANDGGDLPFGVYLLGSAIVAIAAVCR